MATLEVVDLVLERLAVSCASVRSCFSPLDSNERVRRASFSRGVLSYFLSSSLVSARQASAKMPGGNHAAFVGNRRGVRCADVCSSHPLSETTETENGARRHVLEGVFADPREAAIFQSAVVEAQPPFYTV